MPLKDLVDKVITSPSINKILRSNKIFQMITPGYCILPIYNIFIEALEQKLLWWTSVQVPLCYDTIQLVNSPKSVTC